MQNGKINKVFGSFDKLNHRSFLNKIRTVLAVILLAFSIFSIAAITLEKYHECSGEDCPVCFVIAVAEQNLKLLSLIVVFAVTRVSLFAFKKSLIITLRTSSLESNTLISQKIRIND